MPDGTDPQGISDKDIVSYLNRRGYRHADEFGKDVDLSTKKMEPGKSSLAAASSLESVVYELTNEQDSQVSSIISGNPAASASETAASASSLGASIAATYDSQYIKLKKWILYSLDIYKTELMTLLYPIFVHCFLDLMSRHLISEARTFFQSYQDEFRDGHTDDIEKLSMINDVIHLKENSLAVAFRNNKYNLRLSLYSFELFITFLNENRLTHLRKIVNQYIHIIVVEGSAASLTGAEDRDIGLAGLTMTGRSQTASASISASLQPVFWGATPPMGSLEEEVWKQIKNDLTMQIKSDAIPGIIASLKSLRPSEPNRFSPARDRIPLPDIDIEKEVSKLKELHKRVHVGRNSPPSACCFTFHNTYESMTCLQFSESFHMAAGGFSDSYIGLWNLKCESFRQMKPSTALANVDYEDIPELDDVTYDTGQIYKKLIGHSGPVYEVAFSSDQRFLFSGSQDSTVRLWSLDTFRNLVAFRSHQGPVWTVASGPRGYYFASGGSDRTARLWISERPSPVRMFVGHLSDVESLAFHPNSAYLATGSADKCIRLWDNLQGNTVRLFHPPSSAKGASAITTLAFSHDGRSLASGDATGNVNLWDIASGKLFRSFISTVPGSVSYGSHAISSLAFIEGDIVLAAGSLDGRINIFETSANYGPLPLNTTATPSSANIPSAGSTESSHEEHFAGSKATLFHVEPFCTLRTKKTPVLALHFTYRNLLLVGGPFLPNASL